MANMTRPDGDVDEVVRGLTKAQREVILEAEEHPFRKDWRLRGAMPVTRKKLAALGIAEGVFPALTPFGLRVRTALEGSSRG